MDDRSDGIVPQFVWGGDQNRTGTQFKILSLDGGGVRGAFAASFLARMEEKLNISIVEHFDLIAGTSTGGIVAVALAMGLPAVQIESLYRTHGRAIFTRRPQCRLPMWKRVLAARVDKKLRRYSLDVDGFLQSKFGAGVLKATLTKELGDRTLEEAKTRLVVPSVNLTLGQTKVFKTPHLPGMIEDRHWAAVDVILATTAAPTYFPHASIGRSLMPTVDSGRITPAWSALVEAGRIREQCRRPEARSHIRPFGPLHAIDRSRLQSVQLCPARARARVRLVGSPPLRGDVNFTVSRH